MNLKLNPATKEAFIALIASLGMHKIQKVFNWLIAEEKPLDIAKFALLMEINNSEALLFAQNRGELNAQGELVGFLGFSLVPTNHQMLFEGKGFYTWCAADTLIFPAIFGVEATIISTDPIANQNIRIRVNGDILEDISPKTAMISWVDDVDQEDIRCSMCNRVHFFASNETANIWHANNQDVRIFSVAEFFSTDISMDQCC